MVVTFSYRNCDLYNNVPSLNSTAFFFDCDGGTQSDPTQYCASIIQPTNGNPGIDIISNGIMAQAYPTTMPPIQIISQSPNVTGNFGIPYTRSFTVQINSQAIQQFTLNIGDEDDVIESNLSIGTYNLSNYVGTNVVVLSAISPSSLIVPGPYNSRQITFVQAFTLDCPPQGALNLTAPVKAITDCGACPNDIESNITMNANLASAFSIVSTSSSLRNAGLNISTNPNDMCNLSYYNYDMDIKTIGTATVNLTQIEIPINTESFSVQSISIGTAIGNLQLINNNVILPASGDPNGTIIINVQQIFAANPPAWPGFTSSYNNIPGGWITPGPTIILRIRLISNFQNSTNCNSDPIILTPLPLAQNPIKWIIQGACSSQQTPLTTPFANAVLSAPTPPTTLMIDPAVPGDIDLGTTTTLPFDCTLSIPVQSPLQINSGSTPQIWCPGNTTYKVTFSLINGGQIPANTTINNASLNVSVNNIPANTPIIINNSGVFSFDLPSTALVQGFNEYHITFNLENINCPECLDATGQPCVPAPTYGTYQYQISVQAICDDCTPAVISNIGCINHTLVVHCPGDCESVVGIEPEPIVERTTYGYLDLASFYNNAPLTSLASFNSIPGWSALTDQQKASQLKRLYPFDIFKIDALGYVHPEELPQGAPVQHTSLSFEINYPELPIGDFFEFMEYEATFTDILTNNSITIYSDQSDPMFVPITQIGPTFQPAQPINPTMFPNNTHIIELRWNVSDLLAKGININLKKYEIEFKAKLRMISDVGGIITPNFYPVNNLDYNLYQWEMI